MSAEETAAEGRLEHVLAAYLEARDAGWAPAADALLARYPDLAGELRTFLAAADDVDRLAGPLRRRADGPPSGALTVSDAGASASGRIRPAPTAFLRGLTPPARLPTALARTSCSARSPAAAWASSTGPATRGWARRTPSS